MNKYTNMQKTFYEAETKTMKIENHSHHNKNPDYWNILLEPLNKMNGKNGKKVIDFGCGCGRNVLNMATKYDLNEVHGCDISSNNIKYCEQLLKDNGITNCNFVTTDGVSLNPVESNTYDFLMSTIVLQHIPVYDIRKTILSDFYRVLKSGGIISFQMGYGIGRTFTTADYYDNVYDAQGTNGIHDCRVTDPSQIINDLKEIGFSNITTTIKPAFSDTHTEWIYVKAEK
jgi:ubiquinone/menaquinone biosynthesis C-methylase UbiE